MGMIVVGQRDLYKGKKKLFLNTLTKLHQCSFYHIVTNDLGPF